MIINAPLLIPWNATRAEGDSAARLAAVAAATLLAAAVAAVAVASAVPARDDVTAPFSPEPAEGAFNTKKNCYKSLLK